MLRNIKKRSEGFTIIEVLIVLAIAGLIMLIVFLAVPALQRNQRNNARNADASKIAAAITECLANRNGVKTSCDTPAELDEGTLTELTVDAAIADDAADLTGQTTVLTVIGFQRKCNTTGDNDIAGSTRSFAIMYQLEAGTNIDRCIES